MKKIRVLIKLFLRKRKNEKKAKQLRFNQIREYEMNDISQHNLRKNELNDVLDVNLDRLHYFESGDMRFNERLMKEYLLQKQKLNYQYNER